MSKHTPGPLYTGKANRLQGAISIYPDPPDANPCRPAIGAAWEDGCTEEEWIANAHLWRAAPDLLEACKAALDYLNTMRYIEYRKPEDGKKHPSVVSALCNAIAKAEDA